MSKSKLRKLNKHSGWSEATFQSKMWPYRRKRVELSNIFNSEENSVYAESILMYKTYPYITHDLWIEIIDANTSALMVRYNPNTLPDMGPYWAICDTKRFLLGLTKFNPYEFETVEQVYENYKNSYVFAEFPTSRDKYKLYRASRSIRTSFEWLLKKSELKFAKLSRARKKYYANKKYYTWEG